MARSLGIELHNHAFGGSSRANLKGVRPELVKVAELAICICEYDGTVPLGGGLRTLEQAQHNVRNGTGILNSLHRRQSDGLGHAVDLVALTPGRGVVWKNKDAFRAMARAVETAAAILSVPIRQGCDWNMNGTFGESREWDWPHFELAGSYHLVKATNAMIRNRDALGFGPEMSVEERLTAVERDVEELKKRA